MKHLATLVLVASAVSPALAQQCSRVNVPPYAATLSYPIFTRGVWFTAPADFIICSIEVPDESGHGLQNIEVVRFDGAAPPNWPTLTTTVESLGRRIGVPSGEPVVLDISVSAGDVIGVLGTCGDESMMHNSRAAVGNNPFTGVILGHTVEFRVTGMQHNLATTPAQEMWNNPIGTFTRVYMNVTGPDGCYADCFTNGMLNILDYICFGNAYAAGDMYADCDGNGALNILDYICFGDSFAAGCP